MAQSDGVTTEYFSADGLGSVRQLTDGAGSVLLNQTFDPYGNPYTSTGPGDTRFGFTGEQVDGNGLVYLRARYYNPTTGRFLSADPSRQERNPYQYTYSNPAHFVDPDGLSARSVARKIVEEYKGQSAVEALAMLFVDQRLDVYIKSAGVDVKSRLEFILRLTSSTYPLNAGLQFAVDFGELGLCREFQDAEVYDELGWEWQDAKKGIRTNQIGHFLTAVSLAYDPSFLTTPYCFPQSSGYPTTVQCYTLADALGASSNETLSVIGIKLIVGHELVADPLDDVQAVFGIGEGTSFAQQYAAATYRHVALFRAAVEADREGRAYYNNRWMSRDELLGIIFSSAGYDPHDYTGEKTGALPWAQGNSMQDLRLSVKGYRFGQEILRGVIKSRDDAANWLRHEIAWHG